MQLEHLLAFTLISLSRCGLYKESRNVVELSGKYPWDEEAAAAACPVMMEFYASWCPHCQAYVSKYTELARQVANAADSAYIIAAVDCERYSDFCDKEGIMSFPTLRNFFTGSNMGNMEPIDLYSAHDIGWFARHLRQQEKNGTAKSDSVRACAAVRLRLEARNKAPQMLSRRWIPHPDAVWLQDQQRALYQSLTDDVLRVGALTGGRAALPRLEAFVRLCALGFPDELVRGKLAAEVVPFLEQLGSRAADAADEEAWRARLRWLEPNKSDDDPAYLGCRGSRPHLRGYTCALWQVFHALLVNAQYPAATVPHPGLSAVHGWIETFFGCEECREHFVTMSRELAWDSVLTDDDAVLWMWKAHNSVNKRLEGSATEDPERPKLAFPPAYMCSDCWRNDGSANQVGILSFLREFYGAGKQWKGSDDSEQMLNADDSSTGWGSGASGGYTLVWLLQCTIAIALTGLVAFTLVSRFSKGSKKYKKDGSDDDSSHQLAVWGPLADEPP